MLIFQSTSQNEQKDRVYFVVCVVITATEIGAPSVTISPNYHPNIHVCLNDRKQ